MKLLFSSLFLSVGFALSAQNALFIPDTIVGPNYSLTMHKDSMQFLPGIITQTFAFNSNHYLGPTIIFNKGTNVNITINNQIGDTTTVHWHGFHVPAKWDGGPHTPILPSASSYPQFTIMNDAATFWYHTHTDMKTAVQTLKGAAGLIIVRDTIESKIILPRKYNIDDFPVMVQCMQFDSLNQVIPRGMQDSILLVNGTITPYLNAPAQVVRLRLLNGSGERTFNFGFTGNMPFYQIASDGGLLDAPVLTTRVRLSPGERAEVLLNLSGMNGQSFYLMSYASEIAMGIQGGPTMPMTSGPPMNSPLNGIDFNIMQINVKPQTTNPVTTIPVALVTNTPYLESQANITRTIHFTADSITVMDGPFYFNDSTFNMDRIDYVIPINNIEIWKLVNQTMVAHPFHIHDEQFFILDRDTSLPSLQEKGQKDVILVPPGDSARFIVKFTDFADTTIPYMYHCHILMHEDDGMMGQFEVSPFPAGIPESNKDYRVNVFPNPANDFLTILLHTPNVKTRVEMYNVFGQKVLQTNSTGKTTSLPVSTLPSGVYLLNLSNAAGLQYTNKIVISR